MSVLPNVFATLASGNVPASYLDANFNALRDTTPTTQTATYQTAVSDHLHPIQVTGSNTVNLGDAATMVAGALGYEPVIVNNGTGTVTIGRQTATDTLNGALKNITLAPGQVAALTVNKAGNGYIVLNGGTPLIFDQTDPSKQAIFGVSGIATATTRTFTLPDASIKFAGHASGLTANRIPYASGATGGLLTDSANLTYDGTTFALGSDFNIASGKFTVAAASGNTVVAGTLGVTGATTLSAALTYGGVALSNAVTGTGNMVLSASPTFTGTITAAAANFSGQVGMTNDSAQVWSGRGTGRQYSQAGNNGATLLWGIESSTGAGIFPGSTAYAAVFGTTNAVPVQLFANNALAVTISTAQAVTLAGNLTISGTGPHAIGGATITRAGVVFTGSVSTSGTVVDIGTEFEQTITAQTNNNAYGLALSASGAVVLNKAGSGTHVDFAVLYLGAPSIGAGAAGLINSTTLKINAAPSVGTNQRALWVAAGLTQLDGAITVTGVGGAGTGVVSVGAADSGGAGFRYLRIPN